MRNFILHNIIMIEKGLKIFVTALIPFMESKGALVLAVTLKVKWYIAYCLAVLGSYLPVPFLLKFTGRKKEVRNHIWNSVADKVHAMLQKHHRLFEKYGAWALFFLIAIPFTGMGCWTGVFLAELAQLNRRSAAIAIFCGTLVSVMIMTLMTYGLLKGIIRLFS